MLPGGVQPQLLQRVRDLGVDVLAGLGAGRLGAHPSLGVVLGEDSADHRPATVAHAGEDHLGHLVGRWLGVRVGHPDAPVGVRVGLLSVKNRRAHRLT